jgi:hypothetical protein
MDLVYPAGFLAGQSTPSATTFLELVVASKRKPVAEGFIVVERVLKNENP